ncbi:uncharacterized protein G2W53_035032 [Senna tora]|uniref:Uncharacterized protein n=1 Tax=Senna tora TaxID=362788 RepID=A0A834T2X6_9FABA|nr:uncharacterized protein G2W53_035032 [Senna tora]
MCPELLADIRYGYIQIFGLWDGEQYKFDF